VVVTGHQKEQIEAALTGLGLQLAHNARHLEGMGYTVAAGVRALDETVRCALITPGDLPGLRTQMIDRLISVAAIAGNDRIVYPTLPTGEQRNPVLWPRRFFADLAALTGDTGARGLIQRYKGDAMPIPVDDTGTFIDIDRPEDLAAWVARAATQRAPESGRS
jgi:molybdenum cofactor cytidylyltransferase